MSYSYEDVLAHDGIQLVGGVFMKRVGSKNIEVGSVNQNTGALNLTDEGVAILEGTYESGSVVVEDVAADAPAAPVKATSKAAKGGKNAKPSADEAPEFEE